MSLLAELVANPAFAGVVGAAGAGTVLYQLRAIPELLWGWGKRQFTTTLEIDSTQEIFTKLAFYLARSDSVRAARWLTMAEHYDFDREKWDWEVTFGRGYHLLRDAGRWFLIHRSIAEAKGENPVASMGRRQETFYLTRLGRDQAPLRALMDRAKRVYDRDETIRVHLWHAGSYLLADRKRKRALDTIFLPEAQKAKLVGDVEAFLEARDSYVERGVPYRRGYLLDGPPGTGKTSLIFAIASRINKPVYIINLNAVENDTALQAAFNEAGSEGIVVIEDIDTAKITHDRGAAPTAAVEVNEKKGITLSGLLNAVDGIAARDGRLLFITSNHPDKLDPALLRPGRVDVRERLELMDEPEARAMASAWGVDFVQLAPPLPIAPARLQNLLLEKVAA